MKKGKIKSHTTFKASRAGDGYDGYDGYGSGAYAGFLRFADRLAKIAVSSVVAAAILFGSFMAVKSYSDSAEKSYMPKADQYAAAGEYQKAADMYSKYLKKNPGNKTAMLGFLSAVSMTDKKAARDYASAMLASDTLAPSDYPYFIKLCERLGDHELNVRAYSRWLQASPGHTGAMIELAKAHIGQGSVENAADIIKCMLDAGQDEVAAVLLSRIVGLMRDGKTAPPDLIGYCELWYGADADNIEAALALADAYADAGMNAQAESLYRRALEMDVRSAAAYDGLLRLVYQNERMRERYDLLEAAIRNAGGQKYRDMLSSAREKLAVYYSTVREDGVTYKDGIFRITPFDPDGNEMLSGSSPLFSADETSYLIEFHDNLGNAKDMFLDCAKIQVQIADIDYDGVREILIKRYVTAGGMSEEAMRSSVWYDVFRLDRELNKLIYSTPDYKKYYQTTYISSLNRKIQQFEKLSEAMEGHYGVTYGIFYALKIAARDFVNGEWTPDSTGAGLRGRLCQALIAPDLERYVTDKNSPFGTARGDMRVLTSGMDGGGGSGGESAGAAAVDAGRNGARDGAASNTAANSSATNTAANGATTDTTASGTTANATANAAAAGTAENGATTDTTVNDAATNTAANGDATINNAANGAAANTAANVAAADNAAAEIAEDRAVEIVSWAGEGGIYPGMAESDVIALLGPPRYITEEEMKAVRPDGVRTTYLNRIVEYAGINLYTSDGIVKGLRVNTRDIEGPRSLRIGDTTRDIVNKFPSMYFDDVADYHTAKANADIEFADTERGVVLNYTVKNGIIMNIELYFRDASGDWKPGTNIETIMPSAKKTTNASTGPSPAGPTSDGQSPTEPSPTELSPTGPETAAPPSTAQDTTGAATTATTQDTSPASTAAGTQESTEPSPTEPETAAPSTQDTAAPDATDAANPANVLNTANAPLTTAPSNTPAQSESPAPEPENNASAPVAVG